MNEIQFKTLSTIGIHAWKELVQYNAIYWAIGTIAGSVILGFGYLIIRKAHIAYYDAKEKKYDSEILPLFFVSLIFLFIGFTLIIFNGIAVLYPEAATISEIFSKK